MQKSINLIGAGRAGAPIAAILQQHGGFRVQAVLSRRPEPAARLAAMLDCVPVAQWSDLPEADITLIATPDGVIAEAAAALAALPWVGGQHVFVHLSGGKTMIELAALAVRGAKTGSLHPVFAFADAAQSVRQLSGSLCALEGDAHSLPELQALAAALGLRAFTVAPEQKARYHAALSAAANFSVTLAEFAQNLLLPTQIPQAMRRELVASLMRQNADNLLRQTPAEALTGPIVRGDAATVAAHLAVMTASERAVYQSWAKETLALAQARVPADTVARLQALLADN